MRQRREDIAATAQFLLDRICLRYQQRPVVFGPGTLARPISPEMQMDMIPGLHSASHSDNLSLDSVIRHHVQYVLDLNRGNKLRAARQLSISRSTLYRILANQTILAH